MNRAARGESLFDLEEKRNSWAMYRRCQRLFQRGGSAIYLWPYGVVDEADTCPEDFKSCKSCWSFAHSLGLRLVA